MKKLFTILAVGTVLVACNNAPDTAAASATKSADTVNAMAAKADTAATKAMADTSKTMKMDTTAKK